MNNKGVMMTGGFRSRRGFILIMTLMALCITFMMVCSLCAVTDFGMHDSDLFYNNEAASQAAQSGLEYALTRLRKDSRWRGDSNCAYWSGHETNAVTYGSLSKGLVVEESYGNIVGLIQSRKGGKSAFRIKFNYQNSSNDSRTPLNHFTVNGTETPADPADGLEIAMPYVSVNNLNGAKAVKVYRANLNGRDIASSAVNLEYDGRTADIREFAHYVPSYQCSIVVEGLAGSRLRYCEEPADVQEVADAHLNNSAGKFTGAIAHRYVEAYYAKHNPRVFGGYEAVSQGDMKIGSAKKSVSGRAHVLACVGGESFDGDVMPGSLRSNTAGITITDFELDPGSSTGSGSGSGFMPGGKLQTYFGRLVSEKDPVYNPFENDRPLVSKPAAYPLSFDRLTWEDVAKADNSVANRLLGGYYQWSLIGDEVQPFYELRYYPDGCERETDVNDAPYTRPKNSANYKKVITSPVAPEDHQNINIAPLGKAAFNTDSQGRIIEPTLILKGNLYCSGDFCLGRGTDFLPDCPQLSLEVFQAGGSGSSKEESLRTCEGRVELYCTLSGDGALIAQEDVSFRANSVWCDSLGKAAVYSGKSVNVCGCDWFRDPYNSLDKYPYYHRHKIIFSPNLPYNVVNTCINYGEDAAKTLASGYFAERWKTDVLFTKLTVQGGAGSRQLKGVFRLNSPQDQDDYEITCKYDYAGNVVEHFYKGKGASDREPSAALREDPAQAGHYLYLQVPYDAVIWQMEDTSGDSSASLKSTVRPSSFIDSSVDRYITNFREYGDSYWDTVFQGAVYADNDINIKSHSVDLEDWHFTMRGALRAAAGRISIDGASCAALAYDETYLEKMLPDDGKLERVLWNCWGENK